MVRSQEAKQLTIGRLASQAGVGVETVRYYQRRDLIETPPKEGGTRRYGAEDLRRLQFIRKAQAAGFKLTEIKELLDLDASHDRTRARQLASNRIEELDEKIADLTRARDALARLARECGSGDDGPCPILNSFDL